MSDVTKMFHPFAQRMAQENLPQLVIDTFEYYYAKLVNGQTGFIEEADIQPVTSLPDAATFSHSLAEQGQQALPQSVVIKLNGGLGTSMGLAYAKSLLTIKDEQTFLDIIAQQTGKLGVPLVLMNSFATRAASLDLMQQYTTSTEIPLDFVQHKVPKVKQADLTPVDWPDKPDLEWCPPGHGDIYPALVTSGMLTQLLNAGYKYAFVSNADNLGAVLDVSILGYFVQQHLPFLMEVADRTVSDRKGGHLAQQHDGQLILRESAQCRAEDEAAFQDIQRYKYFNTNNLWLNLPALQTVLNETGNILGLPMMCNSNTVDPRDKQSLPVYQLETAMGAAISVFDGAAAVRVPRTRFAPVKTTNDFLVVRSDVYTLTENSQIVLNPQRTLGPLKIDLDLTYYKLVTDLDIRFPDGPPSLVECESLTVRGDVRFGRNVKIVGSIELINQSNQPVTIADETLIDQNQQW